MDGTVCSYLDTSSAIRRCWRLGSTNGGTHAYDLVVKLKFKHCRCMRFPCVSHSNESKKYWVHRCIFTSFTVIVVFLSSFWRVLKLFSWRLTFSIIRISQKSLLSLLPVFCDFVSHNPFNHLQTFKVLMRIVENFPKLAAAEFPGIVWSTLSLILFIMEIQSVNVTITRPNARC